MHWVRELFTSHFLYCILWILKYNVQLQCNLRDDFIKLLRVYNSMDIKQRSSQTSTMFVCLCNCWCVGVGRGFSPHFSGSGKWLYYHTSLSWLLLHITDIRHSLHFCPRQLWACGDHVRNFSGALGFIGCVSYISDKYTYLSKVSENASSLCGFILFLLASNITNTQRS